MVRVKTFVKRKHTGNRYTYPQIVGQGSLNEPNNDRPMNIEVTPEQSRPRPTSCSYNDESVSRQSSSRSKLKYLSMVGDKTYYMQREMEEGNMAVDLEILSKELMNFVACRNCLMEGFVKLVEATTERKGIVSNLVLFCTNCLARSSFYTSKKTNSNHFENNVRLVYGMRSIGKGQLQRKHYSLS